MGVRRRQRREKITCLKHRLNNNDASELIKTQGKHRARVSYSNTYCALDKGAMAEPGHCAVSYILPPEQCRHLGPVTLPEPAHAHTHGKKEEDLSQ